MTPIERLLLYEAVALSATIAIGRWAFPTWMADTREDAGRLFAFVHRSYQHETLGHRVATLIVLLVAVAVRIAHLWQPMRYDESWTYVHYASQSLATALSDYAFPNNHVFHSVQVWLVTRILGDSPAIVRLPAFLAGVLVVPATYAVGRRVSGRGAALFASAIVAGLPILVLYATNARGYSLVTLAFLVLVLLATAADAGHAASVWLAFAIVLAIGMFTIPVMLYPAGAVILWVFADAAMHDKHRLRPLLSGMIRSLTLASVLTLAAYGPVIARSGVRVLTSNQFVIPVPLRDLARALPAFIGSLGAFAFNGVAAWGAALLLVAAAVSLVHRGAWRRPLPLLAVAAAVWCISLALAMHRLPFPRVWLFLVPGLALMSSEGLTWGVGTLAVRVGLESAQGANCASVLLAAGMAATTLRSRAVFSSDETAPLRDGKAMAAELLTTIQPADYLVVTQPTGPPLEYYLLVQAHATLATYYHPGARRLCLIVNEHFNQTVDSVMKRRTDIAWPDYSRPRLLRQFSQASIYTAARLPAR